MITSIIYYGSLIMCISLGSHYQNIGDADMKRNYGTGVGVLLVCLICGHNACHSLLMVWGNIIIIKCCDRRYMHQLSLAYTWMYIVYLHCYIKNIYLIWIHQVQALKLVGLAFEIHENKLQNNRTDIQIEDNLVGSTIPSAVEIMSYCYCFIGLHKGPYYRWKVYADHLVEPFTTSADYWQITEQKLRKACVCTFVYMMLRIQYSPELYKSPSYYQKYGAESRFLYNIPLLVMYVLRCEAAMMLSTSVFTETGLGVYPTKSHPLPGLGPSTQHSIVSTNNTDVVEEEFNFSSLLCFYNKKILLGPKMRDTIKSWDMPTRHWFWSHIYKGLLRTNKEVRSAISFLAWTAWCDPTLPNLISSVTLWVHVHLEAEYTGLCNTTGSMKVPWDIGFSIMRMLCLIYLTPCFVVSDTRTVLTYFNSMLWVYHVILLVVMMVAVGIHKMR